MVIGQCGAYTLRLTCSIQSNQEENTYPFTMGEFFFLPIKYWDTHIFKSIEDSLGTFFKISPKTEQKSQTYMATIFVEMDIAQGLPYSILIGAGEHSYMQTLYYFVAIRV